MGVILPSILVRTKAEIEEKLRLLTGLADIVQIDIVDGILASPPTWPYAVDGGVLAPDWDIHEMGEFRFEIDLMVREPKEAISAFLHAGAGKLVVHLESTSDVTGVINELEERYGRDKEFSPELLSLALSVSLDTDVALLEPHLARIDYVQFMGIARIGQQGIPFDERVLTKIASFKKMHPDIPVQVDGGVSLETAPKLLAVGAERLVVGSALWKSEDVPHTLHMFNELLLEYGRYT